VLQQRKLDDGTCMTEQLLLSDSTGSNCNESDRSRLLLFNFPEWLCVGAAQFYQ
jgi:hypothetical protein